MFGACRACCALRLHRVHGARCALFVRFALCVALVLYALLALHSCARCVRARLCAMCCTGALCGACVLYVSVFLRVACCALCAAR
eukprot:13505439-Alexandrium_andersonii.AAC.1